MVTVIGTALHPKPRAHMAVEVGQVVDDSRPPIMALDGVIDDIIGDIIDIIGGVMVVGIGIDGSGHWKQRKPSGFMKHLSVSGLQSSGSMNSRV